MLYIYIYSVIGNIMKSSAVWSSSHNRRFEDLVEDWNVCINIFKFAIIKDIYKYRINTWW